MAISKLFPYYFYKNLFSKEEINKFTDKIKTKVMEEAKDIPSDSAKKTASVKAIDGRGLPEVAKIMTHIFNANTLNFGYHLYAYQGIFFHYNIYDEATQGEYSWHVDGDATNLVSTSKLTSIINLSLNPYEGGDFFINPFGKPMPVPELKDPGSLVIFPSYTLHQVTPVTKGSRATGAFWTEGPRFI